MRIVWMALLVVSMSLAGCTGNDGPGTDAASPAVDRESFQLQAGKGAIAGLLVDDRYRPIHLVENPTGEFQTTGFVLLQETGQQARTNENGEFTFVDLEPGQYTLRVAAARHEATPQRVTVTEGVFNEMSLIARRTTSDGSLILTQEYSAFIPCSVRHVENGRVLDCTFDQSGDSNRVQFWSDFMSLGDNVTFIITEMQANREAGMYRVQIRNTDTNPWTRYATATYYNEAYIRIQNEYGVRNEEHNWYGDNKPFDNSMGFSTILFVGALLEEEFHDLGFCCGVGVEAGIRAQFVQSVFIGPPEVDLESYCVLC